MKKKCFKCNLEKSLLEFYRHPDMPDGTVNKCKECNRKDVRDNYADKLEEKQAYDKYRHRYSITRFFNHKYSMIKTRCTHIHKTGKIYKSTYGKPFLDKDEWIRWCYKEDNYKQFMKIYNNWVQANFERKLTPSIDRIDNSKGYNTKNLQWLTQSENCIKGNK